jgi:hypothetical protein
MPSDVGLTSSPEKAISSNDFMDVLLKNGAKYCHTTSGKVASIAFTVPLQPHSAPEDRRSRLAWAPHVWQGLQPDQRDRLQRNLARLNTKSFFSGMGTMQQIFFMIVWFMRSIGLDVPNVPETNSTELNATRRRLLCSLPECHRAHHVHSDILHRLPQDLRRRCLAAQLDKTSCGGARRLQNLTLREEIKSFFRACPRGVERYGHCVLHDRRCPLMNLSPFNPSGIIDLDPEDDEASPSSSTLSFVGAGAPCTDSTCWSPGALGDAGPTFLPTETFLNERDEDVVYVECAPGWSSELVQQALPQSRVARIMLDGKEMGMQYNRRRSGTIAIGPRVVLTADLHDFLKICGRECATPLSPDDHLWCNPDDVNFEKAELAKKRLPPHEEYVCVDDVSWIDLVLPSQVQRLQGYRERHQQQLREGRCVNSARRIWDLDQNPHGRPREGAPDKLPCFIKHGTLWCSDLDRPMMALEQAEAHGWPIDDDHINEFGAIVNLRAQLRTSTLSHRDLVSMIGDSWSIPMQGSFFMFLLSIIELAADMCQVPSQIAPHGKETETEPETTASSSSPKVFTPPSSAKKRRLLETLNAPVSCAQPLFADDDQWLEVTVDSQDSGTEPSL